MRLPIFLSVSYVEAYVLQVSTRLRSLSLANYTSCVLTKGGHIAVVKDVDWYYGFAKDGKERVGDFGMVQARGEAAIAAAVDIVAPWS
jgi:hypothetical protein